jgi:chromate transporter
MTDKPSFKEAFFFWLKLGFISFGGPTGQIAIMYQHLVERKKWISNSKFLHALNYCMLLPGPEAQQLATYTGWMLHGTIGGLAAGILFVLPSMFIMLALAIIYVSFGNVPVIISIFDALKPAVVAIVILALLKIAKRSLNSTIHYLFALLVFIAIYFFKIPFPVIIIVTLFIGVVLNRINPAFLTSDKIKESADKAIDNESDYYINANSKANKSSFTVRRLIFQILLAGLLWFVPFIVLKIFSGNFLFWKTLGLFFTKAAFVTFGGAYAVLPYVAQVSVEKFHWLSRLQMIDGLALGETTPGPLIMVLTFVGFIAGFNRFGTIAAGTTGLLLTTYFTFLPCFFFIFSGAPLIESTHQNKYLKSVLTLITAAVTGVILNLTIYFGAVVIFPDRTQHVDLVSVAWILISLLFLTRFKANIIFWILISAIFGIIKFVIQQ